MPESANRYNRVKGTATNWREKTQKGGEKAGDERECAREGGRGRRGTFGRKTMSEAHVHDDTVETRRIKERRDSNGDNNARNDDRNEAKELKRDEDGRSIKEVVPRPEKKEGEKQRELKATSDEVEEIFKKTEKASTKSGARTGGKDKLG